MGIPFLDIIDVLGKVVDKVIPDPAAKMALQLQLATLADNEAAREHDEVSGQIEVDKIEAGSSSLFVAGWRPAIGWVCAAGFAYSYVAEPIMAFIANMSGYKGSFPILDNSSLMTLGMGMLGMGYMRMKEKMSGVQDSTIATHVNVPDDSLAPTPKKKFLGILPLNIPGMF